MPPNIKIKVKTLISNIHHDSNFTEAFSTNNFHMSSSIIFPRHPKQYVRSFNQPFVLSKLEPTTTKITLIAVPPCPPKSASPVISLLIHQNTVSTPICKCHFAEPSIQKLHTKQFIRSTN